MRVVGGRLRGRTLASPETMAIRPTTDRVRESLFNILAHLRDHPIENARVLDLFSGTGALGIEAISRGARFCLFVDDGAEARGLLRENVENLGLTGITKIFRRDATGLGPVTPHQPFSLVFADPPYGKGLGEKALRSAVEGGWIAANALVVLEEVANASPYPGDDFELLDERAYGETVIRLYRWTGK